MSQISASTAPQPRYAAIKAFICAQIESGDWPANHRVPSENQLADQFGVSRMTARRALTELTEAGVLMRSQGLGTFVAESRPSGSLLEVRDIAEEISSRGHDYEGRVLLLEQAPASEQVALALGLAVGSPVFHSVVVHCDNGVPLQWEERFTNPALAPDYLQQDFCSGTPSAYLHRVQPLTEADTSVEAINAEADIAGPLEISAGDACLLVQRRTSSGSGGVSLARLVHPGKRYRLGAQLKF